MALNIDPKFEGKLTCAFKNGIRNWVNFHQSTFESLKIGIIWWNPFIQIRKFMILKSIIYGSFVSWQWRMYKMWRGTDLSVQNWLKEFDKFWSEYLKT